MLGRIDNSESVSLLPLVHFEAAEPPEVTLGCEELIILDNVAISHAVLPGANACKHRGAHSCLQRLTQVICERAIGIGPCGVRLF